MSADTNSSSQRRDVARFDSWASSYDAGWAHRFFFSRVHAEVLKVARDVAPAAARILDVGCGTGALLRGAAQAFPEAELVGVDASRGMIEAAESSNPAPARTRFVRAEAEALPFATAQFDLVLSTMSFHHWADQALGLSEVARTLAPGGSFLLADQVVTPLLRPFFLGERRERFHTRAELEPLLTKAGFTDLAWHDVFKLGPLLLVRAVTAKRTQGVRGAVQAGRLIVDPLTF